MASRTVPSVRDGNRFLFVKGEEPDVMGVVHDVDTNTWYDAMPLQIWFKFCYFEDTTQEEYEQALRGS